MGCVKVCTASNPEADFDNYLMGPVAVAGNELPCVRIQWTERGPNFSQKMKL